MKVLIGDSKVHINFDQAEDLEMLLASEFADDTSVPLISSNDSNDSYDVGYKILDILSCDLSLDSGVLDLDGFS